MNKLTLAAAAVLLAAPALAQTPAQNGGSNFQGVESNVPAVQRGSGVSAGGPASELQGKGAVTSPLTVNPADPAANLGGSSTQGTNQFVPPGSRGSGVTAGGPANDLRRDGVPTTTGTVNPADPAANLGGSSTQGTNQFVPPVQRGSGVQSGGPRNNN